jgi:hypothetical protein
MVVQHCFVKVEFSGVAETSYRACLFLRDLSFCAVSAKSSCQSCSNDADGLASSNVRMSRPADLDYAYTSQ